MNNSSFASFTFIGLRSLRLSVLRFYGEVTGEKYFYSATHFGDRIAYAGRWLDDRGCVMQQKKGQQRALMRLSQMP